MTTPTPNPTVAPTVEQVMAQANDLVRSALTLSHAKIAEYPNLLISIQSEEAKLRLLVEALAVDAERWQQLRSFADPSYNFRAVSHEGSASLRQEHFCTVTCGTWDSLEASLDAVRYSTVKGDA